MEHLQAATRAVVRLSSSVAQLTRLCARCAASGSSMASQAGACQFSRQGVCRGTFVRLYPDPHQVGMPAPVTALAWHHRLNQIFAGIGESSCFCRSL